MSLHTARRALGVAVRSRREERELSQEGFAHLCGLHRTYIGSIERGERNVSLDNIVRIAQSLGTTASELMRAAGL